MKPDPDHKITVETFFEGMIGKNKKRKRKLLNSSKLWKMKEGFFLFPSEGWSLISCAALIGKAEARTGSLLLYGDAR